MTKLGRPPKQPSERKTEMAVMMLTEAQYERLHAVANEKDLTISQVIRHALRPVLQRETP